MPLTRFWDDAENPVSQTFWGRVDIQSACAYLYFAKGGKYRPLLHKLKYQGQQEIGFYLGQQFGLALLGTGAYQGVDTVIPVPLHPKKFRKRGYNQSECIASGIAQGLGRELDTGSLLRVVYTDTQTKKTRQERVANVANAFEVQHALRLQGKHVLLVDDVITTGATLEACANKLLAVENCRVSVAVLAYASN